MTVLTRVQVLREFDCSEQSDLFCVYCYETLKETVEKTLYCPNEMCLNERHYDKEGREVGE
ncbi:MAG: hypothetical protein CL811_10525 [Colwelliaceae bacterium]|jgi:aspartate carbamoyltransferase regulatory subunit|nr:hypothetical protein [Colwelliaceae bacterium]|tara:strand:+ start:1604 stop:1786 length:183 start_codon:yes stop_codon:yes gene_type:complete